MVRTTSGLVVFLLLSPVSVFAFGRAPLSFEERVEAQRAIEKVLWEHRTWPEANDTPKPSFEQWLPAGAIEHKVEDELRKSEALARFFGRAIGHDALQAELDRMVRDSKAPDVLREMLDALGGDATLAAEVLARPALVDRLVRAAFAYDARIHGDTFARATAARNRVVDLQALRGAADRFVAIRYERQRSPTTPVLDGADALVERLDEAEWRTTAEPLARRALGEMGPLEETEHEYVTRAVTSIGPDAVTVSTAAWPKRSFDGWWQEQRESFAPAPLPESGPYVLGDLAPPGSPCIDDTWYPLKRTVPSARMEATTVWTGTEMIVWGGGSSLTGALGTGGRYRPDIDVWTEISTASAPSARRRAAAVWTGTEMFVWGGDDGASPTPIAFDTGGRYNPVLDSWTATSTTSMPSARSYATAVWTGSKVIVWGGSTFPASGAGSALQTGGVYDPATNAWTATSTGTNVPFQRWGHTATWLNGEMIVFGGQANNLLGDGGRYNPTTDTWATMATTGAPGPRVWHTAVVFAGRVLIWGGQRNFTQTWNDGAFYVQNGWSPVGTTGVPAGRMNHHAVVVNVPGNLHMVIYGGQQPDSVTGVPFDIGGGGAYRQVQNDWRPLAGAGAPTARHFSSAVSNGSRMVLWGGASGNTAQGDGRLYDPNAEVWSGMSSSGTAGPSPGPRTRHTLVSTGTDLIVWGGIQPGGLHAFGGSSYAPATDSWTAIDTTGSPSQISYHTAVWTGAIMPVWGGESPFGTVNTGAYWDSFGWTPMATAGAPSVRRGHTAVWAGSRGMIVWGGTFGTFGGVRNDGGIYSYHPLFGDSWAAPPAPVALAGRVLHTATWTGTRMVVFGGLGLPLAIFGDGAAFNPATNTWTMLPTANEPSPRFGHTAVWPGDDSVIVWGGGSQVADGARYSITSNTWTPIASSGLSQRGGVEATSTGREMIVWGGQAGSGASLGDGARYNFGFDGWTSMSSLGAPSARYDYRARQAGDEMYLWGGSSNTDTGGRYCASCAQLGSFETAKDLTFSGPSTMVWTGNTGVTFYGLYRGTIGSYAPFFSHSCLQGGLATPTATDTDVPASGTGWYYLVGAVNNCSLTGLGSGSTGIVRPVTKCP
jgi:N-acetylneuraminic acid mutarotase